MSNPPKRRALGRGLSALLPDEEPEKQPEAPVSAEPRRTREYFRAQIEDIHPAPDQPRRRFAEAELEELAQSIRTYGVIQPLVVRHRDEGGYALVAGERRWRASQRAGLHEVPVVVQDLAPNDAFERALVENLQRSDLNPIEEAEAYSRLVEDLGYTQDEVAERVGKERSTVSNSLRLLRLPDGVRRMVEESQLSMGHARALLALESEADVTRAARKVAAGRLSVRATEALVKTQLRGPGGGGRARREPDRSPAVRDLEHRLARSLGARTALHEDRRGKGGKIEIRYADLDDLDRLLERLLGNA